MKMLAPRKPAPKAVLTCLAVTVTVALGGVYALTPIAEQWRAILLLAFWILLVFSCLVWLGLYFEIPSRVRRSTEPKKRIVTILALAAAGLILALIWKLVDPLKDTKGADVTLRFIYPKQPAVILSNLSDEVADSIRYSFVLWNKDMPERDNPLPIPVAAYDYLNPKTDGGPEDVFTQVAGLLHAGDRIYGSAAVLSKGGIRGHTFLVYIVWGQGGWYAECNVTNGGLVIPKDFTKKRRDFYFDALSEIPPADRIKIVQAP